MRDSKNMTEVGRARNRTAPKRWFINSWSKFNGNNFPNFTNNVLWVVPAVVSYTYPGDWRSLPTSGSGQEPRGWLRLSAVVDEPRWKEGRSWAYVRRDLGFLNKHLTPLRARLRWLHAIVPIVHTSVRICQEIQAISYVHANAITFFLRIPTITLFERLLMDVYRSP